MIRQSKGNFSRSADTINFVFGVSQARDKPMPICFYDGVDTLRSNDSNKQIVRPQFGNFNEAVKRKKKRWRLAKRHHYLLNIPFSFEWQEKRPYIDFYLAILFRLQYIISNIFQCDIFVLQQYFLLPLSIKGLSFLYHFLLEIYRWGPPDTIMHL